jgi:hypothetical protein
LLTQYTTKEKRAHTELIGYKYFIKGDRRKDMQIIAMTSVK